MFYQLLGVVLCHPYELIGREEEEEVFQARKLIFMGEIVLGKLWCKKIYQWSSSITAMVPEDYHW